MQALYTHTEKASLESEVCTQYNLHVHGRNGYYASKFSPPGCIGSEGVVV